MAGKRGTKPKRKTPGKPRRSRYNWVMPRALREPTREELSELNAKLRRHHAEQPLPPELFEKLQNMIERQILLQPMTRHEIDRVRFTTWCRNSRREKRWRWPLRTLRSG